jgi:FKBP-type peptidyl-prolyl cis-trans isomerase
MSRRVRAGHVNQAPPGSDVPIVAPVDALRGFSRWMASGALGPLLLLLAIAILERGLNWLHLQSGVTFITDAGAAQVLAALSLAVTGVLYIVRAQSSWMWAGAVMAATWVLIVGADFVAAGIGRWSLENSAQWTILAALVGFYAYHCHVPGYWGWHAGLRASARTAESAERTQWRGWTAVGSVVALLGVALIASYAFGFGTGNDARQPAGHSTQPASTSKKLLATWASFGTGSNLPPTTLSDGLQIIDVQVGTGTLAGAGDALRVRYIMWLSNGKQADSSDAEGGPFQFTLGAGAVIKGWEEGVPGMRVGGTRRLVIPPPLAYGASGATDTSGAYVVPPNTTLVFIIQLIFNTPKT